ncbi:MAG: tail fiber domain-containing protein [Planctomycetes bacterium]|nr:tail fiber domain-containing protein [Planctomycetota bacterium]
MGRTPSRHGFCAFFLLVSGIVMSGCETSNTFDSLFVTNDATVGGTVNTDTVTSEGPLSLAVGGETRIFVDEASGNVGIGTDAPAQLLHVAGAGQFNGALSIDGALAVGGEASVAGALSVNQINPLAATDPLDIQTDGTSRLFIEAGGNVGIGTETPAQLFHVAGAGQFDGPFSVDGALDVGGATSVAGALSVNQINPIATTDPLDIQTNGSTRLFIEAGGNVGIGTTAPDQLLHVNGGAQVDGTLNVDVVAPVFAGNAFQILTSNTSRLLIESGGDVGIGTSSPSQLLHVAGNGRFNGTVFTNELATIASTDTFAIQTNATNRLFIEADGDVGIGTDTPGGQLDVRGNIRTSTVDGASINALSISAGGTIADLSYSSTTGGATTVSTKVRFDLDTARFFGETGFGRAPTTNRLEVDGTASKTAAGDWLANSDARIKTNVKTVENALGTLDRVRLVSFNYTDEYRAANPSLTDRPYLNVIAQEFREVFPDAVQLSNDLLPNGERILQVDTYPLTIYSAAAVQELHRQAKQKDAEIAALQAQLKALAARVEAIESRR